MKQNDIELIQEILSGNDDAFSTLVRKYQKQVHALAWQIIGDFHIAEEITQDSFLKAYMELKNLKEPQRFAGWLSVITRRRCFAWLRKKRMCTQSLEHLEESDSEQIEAAAYSAYVVEEKERSTTETQRDVVKKLLAKLQESERTVMTLHYFGEMTCAEIGEFLGVSANTIKSRLRRAQQRLQKHEPMIREALEHFKITPNLTDNIMREVSRTKPAAPSASKPFVPWLFAASTLVVVLIMLGFGNSKFLSSFQEPYDFDANSEVTVEIIEAPVMANLALKSDVRRQLGSVNAQSENLISEQRPNENLPLSEKVQEDGTVKHYSQWSLPKHARARLGKGGITAMQYSPDGNQLAVGSSIGTWLYDVKTGKELHLFPGPCGLLAFSRDGRYLVNGGSKWFSGGEFQIWDTTTFCKVPLTKIPPKSVALRFNEDGKTLVSIESGNYRKSRVDSISTINLDTKQVDIKDVKKQFGSPLEYPKVYALTHDRFVIGGKNGLIKLWDIVSGKKVSTLDGHAEIIGMENYVTAVAFSPDGTRLASGSRDKTVLLWDISTGNQLFTLQKHKGETNVLAFSADGKMLATGNSDTTVQLWDTTTGESIGSFTTHIGAIAALAFSPDNNTLATASSDGTVRLWNVKTKNPLPTHITGHTAQVNTAAFSKDSSILANVADNGTLTFWDMKTLHKPKVKSISRFRLMGIRTGNAWFPYFAFSADGTKIASIRLESNKREFLPFPVQPIAVYNGKIHLTDVYTGQELITFTCRFNTINSVSKMVFSPDGNTLAVGDAGIVHLWKTKTGEKYEIYLADPAENPQELFTLPFSPLSITALVFSPDGKKLVSGTMSGRAQMWDVETGDELTTFFEGLDLDKTLKIREGGGDRSIRVVGSEPINDLAFSSNGDLLAVSNQKQTFLFDSKKQTRIDKVKIPRSGTLVFSPDDTILVTGSNGKIMLWDMITGDKLSTLDGDMNGVGKLVFSSDSKSLASIEGGGTVLVWDWEEIRKSSSEKKDPLKQFKDKLTSITLASSERELFAQIAEYGKNPKDEEGYVSILNQIIQNMSNKLSVRLNASLVLAEFYRENDMTEKAEELIQRTGFITEDKWLILGPFDNAGGIGYDTAYIPEDITQINLNAKHNGLNGAVSWQKCADDIQDGNIRLGKDLDWCVAYAFATVTSPDEREVQFRFDSDDQGKVWLNGTEVYAHTKSHSVEIDRYTVPVTLKQGKNSILVKVCEEEEGWGFYLRITDQNGQAFDDLKVNRNVQN